MTRLHTALADRYRVERELGAGGMATIYLAHDVRHDRKVALKVLRPELAAVIGAQRFLAEIKTTANLQHPHILSLFDSGEVEGTVFYVMPFVEGESLRDKLAREKQLPIDEALRIATEAADALSYAHRQGVIHRDIKPENILLHGGHALVADFGIALAASTSGGQRMTETGMSLGTPMYMSPEQAMGERTLDARTDVYALGCVVYEMLAGDPPFTGSTAQAIVAKVLTERPPPLSSRRNRVPPHVEDAIQTALEKLAADRFASAAEFAAALASPNARRPTHALATTSGRPAARRSLLFAAAAGAVVTLLGVVATRTRSGRSAPADDARLTSADVVLPDSVPMAFIGAAALGNGRRAFALSRDGRRLVYASLRGGVSRLYLRVLDSYDVVPLAGTEGAYGPFFSPDGGWIGFFVGNEMRKVRVDGGAPVRIAEASNTEGADWGTNGKIVLVASEGDRLLTVSEDGGPVDVLGYKSEAFGFPCWLPDGKSVLLAPGGGPLMVMDIATRRMTTLPVSGTEARYVDGHLLFSQGSTLFAARFDTSTNRVLGAAVPVLSGIRTEVYGTSQLAVADNGTLIYAPGQSVAENSMVWIGSDGKREPLPLPTRLRGTMELSPDGHSLAVIEYAGSAADLWVYDLDDFRAQRLTSDGNVRNPVFWSGDSRRIAYLDSTAGRVGTFVQALDGTPAERLLPPGDSVLGVSWSRDGRLIGAYGYYLQSGQGIFVIDLVTGKRHAVHRGSSSIWGTAISPDGHLVAYTSDESGDYQNFVEPYPPTGVRRPVSRIGGAEEPRWSLDGKTLFYRDNQRIYAVSVSTTPELTLGEPRVVYEGDFVNVGGRSYAVSPDGKRLLVIEGGVAETRHLRMVEHWLDAVGRLTHERGKP